MYRKVLVVCTVVPGGFEVFLRWFLRVILMAAFRMA